jgi:pantetheine-phosphate adenylyltransferase
MKALYAGSFDPITNGHVDIILQASELFDELVIGIATNPDKHYMFDKMQRQRMVTAALGDVVVPNTIDIIRYSGMTVTFADQIGAKLLIRGLRAVSDFDVEFQMTQFNRRLPPECNTIFFMPDEKNFYLSSTAIRGIARMRGNVDPFVPKYVASALHEKFKKD